MLFYILLLAIVYATTFFMWKAGKGDRLEAAIGVPIVGAVVSCAILMIVGAFMSPVEYARNHYNAPIFSLRTDSHIEGQFSLGSGYIRSEEVFGFYRKDERGAFWRDNVPARNARIFERSDVAPCMIWDRVYYRVSPMLLPWVWNIQTQDTLYDLYVPTNTVIQKFSAQ